MSKRNSTQTVKCETVKCETEKFNRTIGIRVKKDTKVGDVQVIDGGDSARERHEKFLKYIRKCRIA